MITREKTVTIFDITFHGTGRTLPVQAESIEKAHRQLAAELRSMLAELQHHKNKGQENKPLSAPHA